jgi:hypothetical protein
MSEEFDKLRWAFLETFKKRDFVNAKICACPLKKYQKMLDTEVVAKKGREIGYKIQRRLDLRTLEPVLILTDEERAIEIYSPPIECDSAKIQFLIRINEFYQTLLGIEQLKDLIKRMDAPLLYARLDLRWKRPTKPYYSWSHLINFSLLFLNYLLDGRGAPCIVRAIKEDTYYPLGEYYRITGHYRITASNYKVKN